MKRWLMLFVFVLAGCTWEVADMGLSVGSIGLEGLTEGEEYGIVFPIERRREGAVILRSMEIVTQQDDVVDGMEYSFYGATPVQSVGMMPWERYGATVPLDGFRLEGERNFLLYVKLQGDVIEDPLRRLRITYEKDGETFVQLHKVTMLENLHTKKERTTH
ncbi:hypothetical protein IRY55_03295 [Savagea sp. SN6]|uniref:Uncharacterized protein n=1 Tax=Savagea serpentis TaxID=2785297 RepID=A0A8J7KSB2_9BACL|nr:hypothetical protein [Savagea serpentis]MBF4500379.1 hypothetical protein [Savagea serpentis]